MPPGPAGGFPLDSRAEGTGHLQKFVSIFGGVRRVLGIHEFGAEQLQEGRSGP